MQRPDALDEVSTRVAGQSLVGIFEVCERDIATNLAKEESEQSEAQAEYEKMSEEVTTERKDE